MNINKFKMFVRPLLYRIRWTVWCLKGKPAGDLYSFFKRQRIIELGGKYECKTFVETGTFIGDTVNAVKRNFETVLSVEVFKPLFDSNRERFKNCTDVYLWHGDSSLLMPEMLKMVSERAIFWLDGHYSGSGTGKADKECPLVAELMAIARHKRKDHVILIDDARCFGVYPDYPSLEETKKLLLSINPAYQITVKDDAIIVLPPL